MAAALTASRSAVCTGSRQIFGAEAERSRQLPVHSRGLAVRVYAAEEKKEENRGLSFKNNTRAGLGYLEEDSAGQTNIFAVEPRQYVQGSSRDSTQGTQGLTLVGVAGAFALGAIALGLITNSQSSGGIGIDEVPGDFLSLSQYKAKFSATSVAAAPQLAEAVGEQ